jgi:hypothetical protein
MHHEGKDATVNYSMHLCLALATLPTTNGNRRNAKARDTELVNVVAPLVEQICQLAQDFVRQAVSPREAHAFELELGRRVRELARQTTEWSYNHLEPNDVDDLAKHVQFEGGLYTRLNEKTRQHVWSLFGPLALWRVGYRPTDKNGDATLFPLTLSLGLVHGASPALAGRAAQLLAETGMTQQRTLARLRQDCGVGWGVKKLREVTTAVAVAVTEQRHEIQVERLLALLAQADASQGRHKPGLSAGRDGITLGVRCKGGRIFEVASTGTLSVLDRRGQRLGTVYLAYTPESGQARMSRALTQLLQEVFQRWQGTLPHLSYVTDAGDNETGYFDRVLSRMRHPRTGARLNWVRVVDYYHASERLWTMAELLFGKGRRSAAWARKMQKWLKKPGGANRVLHSAAALRDQYGLNGKKRTTFQTAYSYLRDRMRYLKYAEYRRLGIPLGSGVTEAACKTVYTERLKLSGMRWQKPGAQTILDLRVLLLSGVWDAAYARVLVGYVEAKVWGQAAADGKRAEIAA